MRFDEAAWVLKGCCEGLNAELLAKLGTPAWGCLGKAIFHTVMLMHDHSGMTTAEAFK